MEVIGKDVYEFLSLERAADAQEHQAITSSFSSASPAAFPSVPGATELVFDEAAWRLHGDNLLALQRCLTSAARDADFLGQAQGSILMAILEHALDSCAFYRERYPDLREHTPTPFLALSQMAPLSRAEVRENLEALWSDEYVDDDIRIWMTSGATGEPLRFLVDSYNILLRDLSFWYSQFLLGQEAIEIEPDQTLMLRISASEAPAVWYKRLPFFNGAMLWKMPVSREDGCDVPGVIDFIRSQQPPFLSGDPQAFITLIEAWQKAFPRESRYPFRLKTLTCGGTHLSWHERQRIEDFFGILVTNCYATSEAAIIASQCAYGMMHVHSPVNYVEITDADGKPLPDGELGDVLVTHLHNPAFPLLRYRTGDVARMDNSSRCPCGSVLPILYDFQGRKKRMFVRADGTLYSPEPLVRIFLNGGVQQYQLLQDKPEAYRLRYKSELPISGQIQAEVIQTLSELAQETVSVSFERCEQLEEPGVKFRDFWSHCVED